MTQNEKGLQHEMEHKATVEAILADAKAGNLKPLEHYVQMFADDHVAKIPDYYDRLQKMESEAGNSAPEAEEVEEAEESEDGEEASPEQKDEKRVSAAYESLTKPKKRNGASLEADNGASFIPKK